MSSPKRYLWDDDRRHDSWRFNTALATGELPQSAGSLRHELAARESSFSDDFRRGAGGCGADVGAEIADREIDLVDYGGNSRQHRIEDGAGD